jgi:tetratricopeptide (TPR) repeat protein
LYGKENKIDRAIDSYTKASVLKRDDHVPLVNLGYCMLLKGDYVSAEKYYKQALIVNPKASDACLKLAGLYARQGRFREAVSYAEQAESLGLTINPETLRNLREQANNH